MSIEAPSSAGLQLELGDAHEWKSDTATWGATGFGHGGMAVFSDAVYTSVNGELWRIPINPDGSAGATAKVALVNGAGAPVASGSFAADGMTTDGTNIYYDDNDAQNPAAVGVTYKVALDVGGARGTRTELATGLDDPSGLALYKGASSSHLLVNVSQFGKLLASGFDAPATEAKIDKITVKVVTLK